MLTLKVQILVFLPLLQLGCEYMAEARPIRYLHSVFVCLFLNKMFIIPGNRNTGRFISAKELKVISSVQRQQGSRASTSGVQGPKQWGLVATEYSLNWVLG